LLINDINRSLRQRIVVGVVGTSVKGSMAAPVEDAIPADCLPYFKHVAASRRCPPDA